MIKPFGQTIQTVFLGSILVNDDSLITNKILEEIDNITRIFEDTAEADFYRDVKTQNAILASLVSISELSESYSEAFLFSAGKIQWKKVLPMRNIAAHKYESFDMQVVWDTIKNSVPDLKEELIKT